MDDLIEIQAIKNRKARAFAFVAGLICVYQIFIGVVFSFSYKLVNFSKCITLLGFTAVMVVTLITLLLVFLKRATFLEFLAYLTGILIILITVGVVVSNQYESSKRNRMHNADSSQAVQPK